MDSKGQTLIEVMLALAIAVVILSAITVAVISALGNAQFSKDQNIATQYAQQAMESMRRIRDNSSWSTFQSSYSQTSVYCMGASDTTPAVKTVGGSCPLINGTFIRELQFDYSSTQCGFPTPGPGGPTPVPIGVKVQVNVKWQDSKCTEASDYCHQVELISCLADINTRPTIP